MTRPIGTDLKTWQKRQAEHADHLRAQWRESGTTTPFEAWKADKTAAAAAERQAQYLAEQRAERQARNERNLAKQTPIRYRDAEASEPTLRVWAEEVHQRDGVVDEHGRTHGPSVLILGPTGVGKTHQAYGALRHLVSIGGGSHAQAATVADMFAALSPNRGVDIEAAFTEYANRVVLFLDDLGATKASEYREDTLLRLINHRYNHQLATLLTSNVPPRDLAAGLGDRIASRLTEMCTVVVLKGDDRRRSA